MAFATLLWCFAQLPVTRLATIFPLSETYLWSILSFLYDISIFGFTQKRHFFLRPNLLLFFFILIFATKSVPPDGPYDPDSNAITSVALTIIL